MELFINLFIVTLFMNIFLNYIFVCILPNRVNIVPVSPKLSSPQLLFHFRMKTEKFSCSNTFHDLNYRFWRHHRNTLHQKMNMIFVCSNFQKMYLKPAFNVFAHFYQTLFNIFRQNTSPIFYRTNQMIQQQSFVMPLMNMLAHNTNIIQNTNSHPAASCEEFFRLNGKLVLKIALSKKRRQWFSGLWNYSK